MADYVGHLHHVHHVHHQPVHHVHQRAGAGVAARLTGAASTREAFAQRAFEHHQRRRADADATDADDDDDGDEDDDEDDSLREHRGRLIRSGDGQSARDLASAKDHQQVALGALLGDLMASSPSAPANQLLGGSFQFIVQEQAKSMVAIQELQQEVNSLLLFRQAVLAALPHLNQQSNSTAPGQALAAVKSNQTWTRRKHLQQQQYSSLNAPAEPTTAQSTTAHHQVVDSGFSTEASNASNTSPRSSRFDAGDVTMAQQPGDKELVQHLERIQQRLVRLKKDEDRLLALLNPNKKPVHVHVQPKPKPPRADDQDELWRLLDEIELRSHALRDDAQSGKKRVSFQLVDAGTWTEDEALDQQLAEPSGSVKLDRDQVAAVLRLASPVQLQKQLLCALLDNKKLKAQVEAGRSESARRDAQWQTSSQSVAEQVTALREENDDLRFQLEEQKIELEGTKARLRMVTSAPPASSSASNKAPGVAWPAGGPALTSVRVRASSTQTDRSGAQHAAKWTQAVETDAAPMGEDAPPPKAPAPAARSFVPRVIDASPKPRPACRPDQPLRSSGQWAPEPDEDRPSVERRSYTSRIPTPIKPTVIPIVSSPSSYSSGGARWPSAATPSPPVRRELPDTPALKTPKRPEAKEAPHTILMTPISAVQKSRSSPVVHATSERTRHSPEASSNNNNNGNNNNSSSKVQQQSVLMGGAPAFERHHRTASPAGSKGSFWNAWWKL